MRGLFNVIMLIVVLVALADLVIPSHVQGTNAIFNGLGGLWKTSVHGLLGSTT